MKYVGRPPIFKTEEQLREAIEEYFHSQCDEDGNIIRPLTMSGLAFAMGISRDTLLEYGKKEPFSGTVKRAKDFVQRWVEEYLFTGKNTVGAIFNLKNNFNWKDRNETELTHKGIESIIDELHDE